MEFTVGDVVGFLAALSGFLAAVALLLKTLIELRDQLRKPPM
jgi:hypothetical protein